MALFPEDFLEEMRARIPVSAVVGKLVKLKKEGREWKGLSPFKKEKTPSFTVNDEKRFWHDFSSGRHGDIFSFVTLTTGSPFKESVTSLAREYGIALPNERKPNGKANGHAEPESSPHPGESNGRGAALRREIVKVFRYSDADGALIYEVCRQEWFEGGRLRKSFVQRRPGPGGQGHIWGLSAGLYLRSRDGDWYQATDNRITTWRGAERREFDEVTHTLYRFDELFGIITPDPQDPNYRQTIYLPEGEKDCETLREWGLFATTNSGGAKNWKEHHAEYLRDQDVVILIDNDVPGKDRGRTIAVSLRPIARRVRLLSWPEFWPECPDGGDITAWVEKGGGTVDRFFHIVDKLPLWTPQPPDSKFGAIRFQDIDKPGRELEWLIKGVLTRGEVSIWYGQPGCGKSFLLTDAAFAIARGVPWMGHRTMEGLVVYQAGEGALGMKRRMRAYRKHHQIEPDTPLPFVMLQSRVDLYSSDADVDKLIVEIKGWATYYDHHLELVVIDTFNAASPGADENSSKDMGPVLIRCRRISAECGCAVALVDHTPKEGGSPRGWSGKMGNIENAIGVVKTSDTDKREDDDGEERSRPVREMTVTKQKDDIDGIAHRFIIKRIHLHNDSDGDAVTSCVVIPVSGRGTESTTARRPCPDGYIEVLANEQIFRCLVSAIEKYGHEPPAGNRAPKHKRVVHISKWQDELLALRVGHEEITTTLKESIKRRIRNAQEKWLPPKLGKLGIIDKDGEYVWRTDRKVHPIDPPPPRLVEKPQPRILAPGEDPSDMPFF